MWQDPSHVGPQKRFPCTIIACRRFSVLSYAGCTWLLSGVDPHPASHGASEQVRAGRPVMFPE